MAANTNGARARVARYLLGMGPMPVPRPQDIALAQIQGALNRGAFEQPWNMYQPLQAPQQLPATPQGAAIRQIGGGQPWVNLKVSRAVTDFFPFLITLL